MLRELYIKNFGIFAESRLQLQPGMTVFTGETGAGKSLVVGAINLSLGARAHSDDIRSGASEAEIEATYEFRPNSTVSAMFASAGLPLEIQAKTKTATVVVRRLIQQEGRSRSYLNDKATTVGFLAQLAPHLVDLAGQHDQQLLLDEATHLGVLDRFACHHDAAHATLLTDYAAQFEGLKKLQAQRRELERRQGSAAEQRDFLGFRIKELEALGLTPGEEQELTHKRERMQHGAQLFEMGRQLIDLLDEGDGSASEKVEVARRQLEKAAQLDGSLTEGVQQLQQAVSLVRDVARHMNSYLPGLEFDPSERDSVEERLLKLSEVRRRYGGVDAAIDKLAQMRDEIAGLENLESDLARLTQEISVASGALLKIGAQLSASRTAAAKQLKRAIEKELAALAMEGARLEVRLSPPTQIGEGVQIAQGKDGVVVLPSGLEEGVLYFSANPGEPPKPLARIASGGELSRVLLAIKLVLYTGEGQTFVFDEIDTGVGGKQAEMIGQKLRQLAGAKLGQMQVFSVTHLATIAAFADHHFFLTKQAISGRTVAQAAPLSPDQRRQEIARLLSGSQVTAKSLSYADELLSAVPR